MCLNEKKDAIMKILEQFIAPKTGRESDCEDGYVLTDNFAAVVDGATSKHMQAVNNATPGRTAMLLICRGIESLDQDVSAREAFKKLDHAIYAWYQQQGTSDVMKDAPSRRCSASAVVYSRMRRELWFIGDCQGMVDGHLVSPRWRIDEVMANLRSLLIHTELAQGVTEVQLLEHDTSRVYISDLLKRQMYLQNRVCTSEYNYYVLDGFLPYDEERAVQVVAVPGDAAELVLSSDGYPAIYPTLDETERALARLLEEDPLCYRVFKSTKGKYQGLDSYDDRCFLHLDIAAI